jgi:hypothetical protein
MPVYRPSEELKTRLAEPLVAEIGGREFTARHITIEMLKKLSDTTVKDDPSNLSRQAVILFGGTDADQEFFEGVPVEELKAAIEWIQEQTQLTSEEKNSVKPLPPLRGDSPDYSALPT